MATVLSWWWVGATRVLSLAGGATPVVDRVAPFCDCNMFLQA